MAAVEREEGEGMENTEVESVSSGPGPSVSTTPSIVTLEDLLASDDKVISGTRSPSIITLSRHSSVLEDTESMKASLSAAHKKIEHMSELLHESEATIMRLNEQTKVLKNEIRRLERNQERERAVSNLEYLKNVLLKFLTLSSGDEKLQLIPVLTTMLTLSPEEKQALTTMAQENFVFKEESCLTYMHAMDPRQIRQNWSDDSFAYVQTPSA
ncbi:PREDICTED: GRIP and coiled-coil domain-containing protein 2-like [Branchiostoma belcheri]|uniref:GRIP and coiled-coil domain-containing protein 2-like n=1 Tax=Branchiostoma belcheri TaxID=7741 RepID=A0A6P4YTJ7_BRABE|nr:PREDICTED: GRIP and coiled-coil domain-containing protein 2-like [Branchiostoma belcheri]